MRNLFIFLAGIFLITTACNNQPKQEGDLSVHVPDMAQGTKVYLSELGKGNQPIALDTVEIQNGVALMSLPKVDFQTLNILTIDGVNGNIIFINENEPVKIDVNTHEVRKSAIEGGKANQLFSAYIGFLSKGNEKLMAVTDGMSQEEFQDPAIAQQIQELQLSIEKENTAFRKEKIAENPDQFPSILLLNDMIRTQQVPVSEMKEMYGNLSKEVRNTYVAKEVEKILGTMTEALKIGDKAPSFTAKTPEGKELSLEDALGKYTLLDFWAGWCKPCRVENPNIVKAYEQYKDRGFQVLGVSLDRTEKAWLDAIEADGLEWNQVSNLKFWQDPIAKEYGIKAIPASYLLDENGVIIGTNLRGPALHQKLEELLGS